MQVVLSHAHIPLHKLEDTVLYTPMPAQIHCRLLRCESPDKIGPTYPHLHLLFDLA